ncbi:MAG: SDR family NAD(P)-dependent oxidoreductase [Verrucomicrobiaceae bacterium]|nr:SDR family NAD(P)-dependent oxidoreductase [Verrucomicrobiaceae bacterium]
MPRWAVQFSLTLCSAVITGASSGLGAEFARQLAPRACCLVLAARREEALAVTRDAVLAINPAVRVVSVPCDLATPAGREALITQLEAQDVHPNLLINNAGMGDYGTFESATQDRLSAQIALNISALVQLTHALVPRLKTAPQQPAGILNVSSLAGVLPMPDLAVYAATKAFVTSFSEALAVELAEQNIAVSCVCPGPTPTNFSKTARRESGSDTDRAGQDFLRIPPAKVVSTALEALQSGDPCVYPGLGVSLASSAFRIMPRFLQRAILRRRFANRPTQS